MTRPASMVQSQWVTVEEFIRQTKAMNGRTIRERPFWNTAATADSIRQFAFGISDDNPLWVDAAYAENTRFGRRQAPPAFLASVQYPVVHGSEPRAPLTHLVGEVEFEWHRPILEGDQLRGICRQTGCFESARRMGQRSFFVEGATQYWNADDEEVACARTTLAWIDRQGEMLLERPTHRYSDEELARIQEGVLSERRHGSASPSRTERQPGSPLPSIVRGPLTLGDMICWHSAAGPNYRASALAFRDHLESPHGNVLHPVFSWPVKTSQQHEDPLLCRQRGLPGPFDNGVMRFAYASTLLTNWMGDDGFLKRLSLRILEPNLYGDVTWFHGRISRSCETAEGTLIHIDVRGENQLGQTTTAGEAEALLPPLTPAVPNKRARTGIPEITSAEAPIGEDPVAAFERVCKQTPNRTAVLFRGVPHTYAELERQVDEISRSLDAYGLEPGMMVGLRLPRSPTLIASILAVLKARCAFLPLAPDQALTRTRNMLNDSEPHFVLADRETLKGLADENNAFELSKALFCVPFRPKAPLRTDLAAVIYTSGSSGLPKGVLVKRTSLARYIPEIREALDITERDVYLHSAAFTFSASLRQLFTPLSVGAVVCLADFEETHAPLSLLRLIARSGTTVWDTVPTIWSHILEELGAMNPDRRREALSNQLRMIAFTGEPFPWSLLDTWRSYRPARVEIVNLYSQTETGSVCAHHVPHDERHPSRGIVPLGQAFGSVQVYLLDDADQRVAPGGIGELCVEGCRLAGGYLNDTALTNRKFRQDSCNDTPGRRVFHTGDLAVENPHGQFEYLGRKDRQVKIRGIRVQPAEIEHALRQHPSVSAAIVLLREGDGPSKERFLMPEKRLIGFVVTRRLESTDALEPTSAELKRFLRTQLPGFMIPDDLWVVDALPINDSGKVDRDALRKRQASLVESEEAYVAPMTEIERALAAIWRDLLGLEAVSVTANFFDLGGHSLMAARMVSRVNDAFGRQTPLSEFFAEPTIRRLAQTIDDGERTADWHEADQ